jgi:hypothetical protein
MSTEDFGDARLSAAARADLLLEMTLEEQCDRSSAD